MLKIGLCCSFLFPATKSSKNKFVNFLYYTLVIPLVTCLFFLHDGSQPYLFSSYGSMLITLVVLLWLPTIYARYQRSYWNKFSLYSQGLSLLLFLLYMVFQRLSLFTFFIFFEISLVPVIAILFLGGSSNKKLEAGLYIFVFTSSSAFIFLTFLVFNRLSQNGVNHFLFTTTRSYNSSLRIVEISNFISMLIYNLTTIVLLVKTPIFFVHIWLPKAHVEAPVFASMILARLLLKTGGYGYLILFINSFGVLAQYYCSVCSILLMSILASVRCSTQVDIKILIAYSSVNHMRVMLCGIILGLRSSTLGSVVLMIGHGIISSVLFFLARDSYTQIKTRSSFFSLLVGKSNNNMVFWLILTLINAGLPPFLIFIGEALILKATLIHPFLIFLFLLNYIFIGYYSCLILVKLILSTFPTNVGRLIGSYKSRDLWAIGDSSTPIHELNPTKNFLT